PAMGAEAFEAALAADADGAYVRAPLFEGEAAEAGPLARRTGHPLIVALLDRYGNGVLARLAARLVDMQAALEEMTKQGSALPPPRAARPLAPGTGSGTGLVEAARGLLVHRVEITEGMVRRWQILAPTEWNFHPHGPLARGLERAHVGNRAEALARLAVIALDPCVACEVKLR
ncbi:MAG: nickel-dependent hydrogenase large subunit, partial [Rhodospirillales bacterium]|nr:nickel-dependent hydrogenase large subunit [Rhodospirillales bacterium]